MVRLGTLKVIRPIARIAAFGVRPGLTATQMAVLATLRSVPLVRPDARSGLRADASVPTGTCRPVFPSQKHPCCTGTLILAHRVMLRLPRRQQCSQMVGTGSCPIPSFTTQYPGARGRVVRIAGLEPAGRLLTLCDARVLAIFPASPLSVLFFAKSRAMQMQTARDVSYSPCASV